MSKSSSSRWSTRQPRALRAGRSPQRVARSCAPTPFAAPTPTGRWSSRHRAPRKTFVVAISGNIEVEVSDGQRLAIAKGDLVYLEDTTGKGHVTRLQGAVTNLFIPVGPDFDVLGWVERHGAPEPDPG